MKNFIYGINPALEALKASGRRCQKIVVEQGKTSPRLNSLQELARSRGVKIETLSKAAFQKQFSAYPHQGAIAYLSPKELLGLGELIDSALKAEPRPALALLDGVLDPGNLGAIIRSAWVLGVRGIILPKNRAAPLNETVAKCSAGAVEHLPACLVANASQAIETLKQAGFWVVGLDAEAEQSCDSLKFDFPSVLLIGGEEKGIRPLLKKSCDFSASIPMQGELGSLNVSAAAAIMFYEVMRQKK